MKNALAIAAILFYALTTDAADWPSIYPVLGETFGDIRPASTAIIAGLVDSRMKVEIEVTARKSK